MMDGADFQAVLARLRQANHALFVSHQNPDGDAIGSELALAELAQALGVKVTIANHDPAGGGLAELPGADRIIVSPSLPDNFPEAFDLVVTLECPGLDRPGFTGLDKLPILNIDHHEANDLYGEINCLDSTAPAVGEMVWQMFDRAGVSPSAEAALNCFVALITDTGDFRYSNATPRAFRAAAEMVSAGADPVRAAELVHHRQTPSSVRLLGEVMSSMTLNDESTLAVIEASPDAFKAAAAEPQDTENLVNVPRAIRQVRIVAFLKQWQAGSVRVSLRSKGDINVQKVAAIFGGGGHVNAAGFGLEGNLASAKAQLIPHLEALLKETS
ncbi:MAG: bifunctional oligoribonuclease/PAP phosphatase NrnA [bacterium]|nr:bifunctional oligoribonuclease/PAP phosphatase NrnA [bacterium]